MDADEITKLVDGVYKVSIRQIPITYNLMKRFSRDRVDLWVDGKLYSLNGGSTNSCEIGPICLLAVVFLSLQIPG